jgi:hypothetical protein
MGVYIKLLETDVWIHKTNIATELAIKENSKKKMDKELVPEEYHKYLDIFNKEKAYQFFESKPWDHKIKMKEGFEPKSFKNYNLIPAEPLWTPLQMNNPKISGEVTQSSIFLMNTG